MRLTIDFLLEITRATTTPEPGGGKLFIIVRSPYRYLERELRKTFEGQEDVKVIVDRRIGERRTNQQPVAVDHRQADRRRPKEAIVDVILSASVNSKMVQDNI